MIRAQGVMGEGRGRVRGGKLRYVRNEFSSGCVTCVFCPRDAGLAVRWFAPILYICFAFRLSHGARRLHLRQEGARRAAAAAHRSTPQHSVRRAVRAQVTQTRAGPRKTIDSSRIHPSRQGLFAAVAPKPLRPDEYPQETWRKKPPPPGAYDENGATESPCTLCRSLPGRLTACPPWPDRTSGRAEHGGGLEPAVRAAAIRPVPPLDAPNARRRRPGRHTSPSGGPGVRVLGGELAGRALRRAAQGESARQGQQLQQPRVARPGRDAGEVRRRCGRGRGAVRGGGPALRAESSARRRGRTTWCNQYGV